MKTTYDLDEGRYIPTLIDRSRTLKVKSRPDPGSLFAHLEAVLVIMTKISYPFLIRFRL